MPNANQDDWRYSEVASTDFSGFLPLGYSFKPEVISDGCAVSFEAPETGWAPQDKFEAAMKAFHHSSTHIRVPPGAVARAQALFAPESSAACFNVIELGAGSALDYYEDYSSEEGKIFFASKTVFILAENSTLNYYPVQRFGDEVFSIANREFRLGENSKANLVQAEFGAGFSRVKVEMHFDGNACSSSTNKTVFYGSASQRFDLTTNAFHHGKNTKSDVVVKGALSGNAQSVYRGLIKIDKSASGTDSFLHDRVLHLSRGVRSNSIPSLVIDNNDVRASHGATISKVSEEMLFYLESRGMPKNVSKGLIVEGFINDIVSSFPEEAARGKVKSLLELKVSLV